MAFELDHLFIMTAVGAPVADQLVALGLVEGSSNLHPGQGTENRRFFFRSAGLELLWVHDPGEAQSERIQRTHLWERWTQRRQRCPFGICLRSTEPGNVAFSHWEFRPPYLPPSLSSITVATNSDRLDEPLLFQTPFGKRPDQFSAEKAQPLEHALGLQEVTRMELISPQEKGISPELQAALAAGVFQRRQGSDYCVELGFDQETAGKQVDLRPALPLILSW